MLLISSKLTGGWEDCWKLCKHSIMFWVCIRFSLKTTPSPLPHVKMRLCKHRKSSLLLWHKLHFFQTPNWSQWNLQNSSTSTNSQPFMFSWQLIDLYVMWFSYSSFRWIWTSCKTFNKCCFGLWTASATLATVSEYITTQCLSNAGWKPQWLTNWYEGSKWKVFMQEAYLI